MYELVSLLTLYPFSFVVKLLSCVRFFATPWTVALQASLSFTISRSLLKLMFCVGDAIQPSRPLSSPSPAFNLSQHQALFQRVSSSHRWLKYCSFSFSISPSNEYSGLIPLGLTSLISLQSKSLLQHHSSKASVLRCSAFFMIQLSHPYLSTRRTVALTR